MKIRSEDVPQADELADVVRVVEAVHSGAVTDYEIAEAIGKVRRQGRYYRRAAEILRFVHNPRGANRATITQAGRYFLSAESDTERQRLLSQAVLGARMFQRVVPLLESHSRRGITRTDLQRFISEVTEPVGDTMIPRRVSSVVNWLSSIGLLERRGDRYYLTGLPAELPAIQYDSLDEPLVPSTYDLRVYENATRTMSKANAVIPVLVDMARRERANAAHRLLINLVADKLRTAGAIPRFNQLVDLAATVRETPYMFEMKSNTPTTFHAQLRRAIAQLYEYRYLIQAHTAKLVVVMEQAPTLRDRWLLDYVVQDRGLLIVWDGQGNRLRTPPELARELAFLVA